MNETYEEYINRKLSESVQYKPKEEDVMSKYYNYEVEEQEEERPKEPTDWGGIVTGVIFYGAIIGLLICAIIGLYFGS